MRKFLLLALLYCSFSLYADGTHIIVTQDASRYRVTGVFQLGGQTYASAHLESDSATVRCIGLSVDGNHFVAEAMPAITQRGLQPRHIEIFQGWLAANTMEKTLKSRPLLTALAVWNVSMFCYGNYLLLSNIGGRIMKKIKIRKKRSA